jgi:hypothetical protein
MNDNDLRRQAVKEFAKLIPRENILFSKQLQRINAGKKWASLDCKLLIIDESHYASNTGSQVDIFIRNIPEESRYTLSISATPMAEIVTARDKNIGKVFLQPGRGYYGIAAIFKRDLVHQAFDITNNRKGFLSMVEDYYHEHDGDPCYNIVRLPNQWYFYDLQQNLLAMDLDIEFINHHGSYATEADFNDYIDHLPEKFTIIWIYNSLRAGKQVNTKYLGFVHDTSISRPDTVAQSLLGRMMGYGKAGHHVTCYTDLESAKLMLKWTKTAYSDQYIPRGSRSVLNGHAGRQTGWNLHRPICVELSATDQAYYRDKKMKCKNRYPYKADILRDIIRSADPVDRDTVEKVIKEYTPGKCGGLMVITEFNAPRTIRDYWYEPFECYTKYMPCSNVDLCNQDNQEYFYVYVNLIRASKDYGKALVVYKERIDGEDMEANYTHINIKSRFHI